MTIEKFTNMDHALDWDPITKSWGGNDFDAFVNKIGGSKHILEKLMETDAQSLILLMHSAGLLNSESSNDGYAYDSIAKQWR
jgi:hypothetical protein